jgi:phage virion morphogenesis protein
MAGVTIKVEDAELQAKLAELIARAEDVSPALQEIGEVLVASTKARFSAEQSPDGTPWAANTEVTKQRKTNPKILTESGLLGDLIQYQVRSVSGTARSVEVGSNRVYAAMQQFGGTKAEWPHLWGDIPERPFLGVSTSDKESIMDILSNYLAAS